MNVDVAQDICTLYRQHGYFKHAGTDAGLRESVLHLLAQQRLIWHYEGRVLAAYVESWRLDYAQWGRKVCHERIDIHREDIVTGPVCYFANVVIHPDYRRRDILRVMRDLFFAQNRDATYFVGLALRKKAQPIKVFRAADIGQTRFLAGVMEAMHNG